MNSPGNIYLTQEKETLLITLYAKALDYREKHSVLKDQAADNFIKQLNYDFSKFNDFGNNNIIVVRAKQYDEWIKAFLITNKDAVILNLGCGLDTRITRIDPSPSAIWFDVDYPEVIQFRKNFYQDHERYTMIGSSITEDGWLMEIPNNRPVLIIAEGVLEYLTPEEVKILFNRLIDHFSHGKGGIMFDVMSSFAIRSGKEKLKDTTGAVHKWAVDDPGEVDKLNPALKRITELSIFRSVYIKQLSFKFRLLYGIMSLIPQFRNMLRLMRYTF